MSMSEKKWIWLTAVSLAAALFVLWIVCTSEPYRVTVLFDEIGSLEKGDPVMWKSFRIGRVEAIQPLVENKIGVVVRINEDYASSITYGTAFNLRQASFLGLMGNNLVEAVPPPAPGRRFSRGEKVVGTVVVHKSILESGKAWTVEQWRQLRDGTSAILEQLRSSPLREDAESALADLHRMVEEGTKEARANVEQFRKDHQIEFDALERKLERIRDALRKLGDEPGARQIERQLEKLRGQK